MAFIEYNPNPRGINTGDCVIRAICKALGLEWEKVYMDLTVKGLQLCIRNKIEPAGLRSCRFYYMHHVGADEQTPT